MEFDHTFRYRDDLIRLICDIELIEDERRLVLLDVLAASPDAVDAVPDWVIEYEAMCAADERDAQY